MLHGVNGSNFSLGFITFEVQEIFRQMLPKVAYKVERNCQAENSFLLGHCNIFIKCLNGLKY